MREAARQQQWSAAENHSPGTGLGCGERPDFPMDSRGSWDLGLYLLNPSPFFLLFLLLQTYRNEMCFDKETIVHIEERNNGFHCHVYKLQTEAK